jgi:hypothetical protein
MPTLLSSVDSGGTSSSDRTMRLTITAQIGVVESLFVLLHERDDIKKGLAKFDRLTSRSCSYCCWDPFCIWRLGHWLVPWGRSACSSLRHGRCETMKCEACQKRRSLNPT